MTSPFARTLDILGVLIADQDASIRYSLPMVATFLSLADAHPERLTASELSARTGLQRESVDRALGGLGEYAKDRAASPVFMVEECLNTDGQHTFGLNSAGAAMRGQILSIAMPTEE
jgi:hypothetical protein